MGENNSSAAGTNVGTKYSTPAVLKGYTAADHRRRLKNIALCEHSIRKCMRKHFIRDYIPGHCVYRTHSKDMIPDEADDIALAKLKEAGIGLIQIWARSWKDPWGGKPMYQASNPRALRDLIDLAHKHGLKIIPYTSTNFFERTDPNFCPEWALDQQDDLVEHDYHLAHCSFASPGWRELMLTSLSLMLDEYGFDGLYNDMGYHRTSDYVKWRKYYEPRPKLAEDEIDAFEESPAHDGALQDVLGLIYSEIKRRGGIYKLHKEGFDRVYTDFRVYDYLWVGEAVKDMDVLRNKVKNYEPYITPEYSRNFNLKNENELYMNFIPYMQFPVLRFAETGGKLEKPETHAFWLKQYAPMVEEGTWAWLDITDSDLLAQPLPQDVVISAFANRSFYLVMANMGDKPATIMLKDQYVSSAEPLESKEPQEPLEQQEPTKGIWELEGRTIRVLRRKEHQHE